MDPDTRQCVRQLQISAAVGKQCAHFCDIVQIPPAARAALCSVCVFVRLRGMRVYLCDVVQDSPAARRCATHAYLCDVVHDSPAAQRCATRAYLCDVVQDSPAVRNACVFVRCRARFLCRVQRMRICAMSCKIPLPRGAVQRVHICAMLRKIPLPRGAV